MDVSIRDACCSDLAALTRLLEHLGYAVDEHALTERIERLRATGCDPFFVAVYEDRVVGLLALHWATMIHLNAPLARITALVVTEEMRGRGVGKRLIAQGIETAREAGCSGVELTSALSRAEAHGFYKAQGFSTTSFRFYRSLR